jgi:hypothetical protein
MTIVDLIEHFTERREGAVEIVRERFVLEEVEALGRLVARASPGASGRGNPSRRSRARAGSRSGQADGVEHTAASK